MSNAVVSSLLSRTGFSLSSIGKNKACRHKTGRRRGWAGESKRSSGPFARRTDCTGGTIPGFSSVQDSKAQKRVIRGDLSFGDFSLAIQRKVTRLQAEPESNRILKLRVEKLFFPLCSPCPPWSNPIFPKASFGIRYRKASPAPH